MPSYPIETRILIGGVEAYTGGPDSVTGTPTILDGVQFQWGRTSNVDQPDTESASFVIREQLVGTETSSVLDNLEEDDPVEIWVDITMPDASVESHLLWAGNVLTAVASAVGDTAVQTSVTATGIAAPLADETIGDQPWPAQTMQSRVNRTLQLATTDTVPISLDATLADVKLSYRDVDAQPVLGLLQDSIQSAGGVLWVAADAVLGTYLWAENPANRPSLRYFKIDETTGVVTIAEDGKSPTQLSAADVLRDPIQWTRDKSQIINSVDVSWLEQTVGDDGIPAPTQHTVTLTATPTPKVIRKLSIETELTTELEAQQLAARLLALTGGPNRWVASGVTIDTIVLKRDNPDDLDYLDRLRAMILLLDGAARLGRALTIIDLQSWAPSGTTASMYVEGGTYTLTNGRWQMDLNVSGLTGQGKSATFADFANTGVKFSDFDHSLRFIDCAGVSGPYAFSLGFGGGRFGEQPFGA